jgi:uncharacterized protein
MRVVLAGGSGFVGAAVSRELLDAGHAVSVLTRNTRAARSRMDPRVELVEWDGRSSGAWERVMDGAGGIFNLAGETIAAQRWSGERKQRLRASRLDPTAALVRGLEKAADRPAVLVSASAVGYYGARGDESLTEDAVPGQDFLAVLCQEWERAARAAEALGVRVVRMRLGIVVGAGGGALEKMLLPFRMFVGGPLGNGRQWVSWIHRDDVAGIFRFALENDAVRGALNATAPEPVTMAMFCRTLGRVLGRPSWAPVPALALRLVLGEMASILLTGQRVEPHEALRLGYRFRFARLEPALRAAVRRP